MSPDDFATLREAVQNDEGLSLTPYTDSVGKITVGYGTNLSDGITKGEANWLLDSRLTTRIAELTQAHPVVLALTPTRQIVLSNMAYNLGVPKLNGFVKMWAAIDRADFEGAAEQMLDSAWAKQVGLRAVRLAAEMASGEMD